MTDEEVLEIARGLSPAEWKVLERASLGRHLPAIVATLIGIRKGVITAKGLTPLGSRVYAWRELFWSPP